MYADNIDTVFYRDNIAASLVPNDITPQQASYIALTDVQKTEMDRLLMSEEIITDRYRPRVFPGTIAIDGDILDRSAELSVLFQRACKECFGRAQKDPKFMQILLQPFEQYPSLQEDIVTTQFFMEFYRIDFYANPQSRALSIIEVNTSPGSLPEHVYIDSFLSGIVDTTPPAGMLKATTGGVLDAFELYLTRVGKNDSRYFGLIIREEGSFSCLPDARMNARKLREHFPYVPVFCTLDQGTVLDLFHDEPQPIDDIRKLDILYVNPGSSMRNRNAFTQWLKQEEITLLPPRSNLLFTNKSFLTILGQTVDSLRSLDERERNVLKEALIPSFSLANLEENLDTLRSWEGAVVKRDLGSSGINVHVYRHPQTPPEEVLGHLRTLKKESDLEGETWTVQAYRRPSSVLMDGAESFFEIMVYTVLTPTPSVVFATRAFQGDKANTHFGAYYGNLCRLH